MSTAHVTCFVTTYYPHTILSDPKFRLIKIIWFNGQKRNTDLDPELRGQEVFIALALWLVGCLASMLLNHQVVFILEACEPGKDLPCRGRKIPRWASNYAKKTLSRMQVFASLSWKLSYLIQLRYKVIVTQTWLFKKKKMCQVSLSSHILTQFQPWDT